MSKIGYVRVRQHQLWLDGARDGHAFLVIFSQPGSLLTKGHVGDMEWGVNSTQCSKLNPKNETQLMG